MSTAVAWFERMQHELTTARKHCNATRARLAPDFNAIRFLRRDEHGLSIILADLLDPNGSHGQGRLFLSRFIELFWHGKALDCDPAKIHLELVTDTWRRIDIVIRFGDDAVLGIESKLCHAADQDRQVEDYLKYLGKLSVGDHRLIYLTPQRDRLPGEESIGTNARQQAEAAGRLLCICADDLADWLDGCIGPCRAERVRAFLGDLIDYLKTDVQGIKNMNEHDLIVQAAIHDMDSVRDALRVVAAGHDIRKALLVGFADTLKKRMTGSDMTLPPDWTVDISPNLDEKRASISLRPKEGASHRVALSFEAGGANYACIGISKTDEHHSNDAMTEVRDALVNTFGQGLQDSSWPWYRYFDPIDWGNSPEVMARLLDSEENGMAAQVIREFSKILDVLKGENLLGKFRASIPNA